MRLLSVFIFLFLMGGCATLNESECQNADWQMIGMADGTKGRLLSYIDKHRQACAKHGVTPDLIAYRQGHAEGLVQYCTEYNGYKVGKAGVEYNGVCPANLSDDFLTGYQIGKNFYTFTQDIRQAESDIKSNQNQMKELKEKVHKNEKNLVSDDTTVEERRRLLEKVKEFQRQIGELESKISISTRDKTISEAKLERFKRKYNYD